MIMMAPALMDSAPTASRSVLTVDLTAIAENHRHLQARLPQGKAAAVVKADGYGLGAGPIVKHLYADGVRSFFVAHVDEALALRQYFPQAAHPDLEIFVLNGLIGAPAAEAAQELAAAHIIPVLNDPDQIDVWSALSQTRTKTLPAAIHVDTGMSRLGLTNAELTSLIANPLPLSAFSSLLLISHLACADEPAHPLNAQQADRFAAAVRALRPTRASLANSSGIFLDDRFQHDLARPGIALYGGNPTPDQTNPMRPVVTLAGRILQVRESHTPLTVGYGASHIAAADRHSPARIATVAIGYADGFLRCLGNQGYGFLAGKRVPLVGRVSMDQLTFDVSALPPERCRPGDLIEILNGEQTIEDLARRAQTIGYEILTALGHRYARRYIGAD